MHSSTTYANGTASESGPAQGARRATVAGPDSGAAARPNSEVSAAKAHRRRFTAEYKLRIVREAERCTTPGSIGALLRREGLYSSHLATWREQQAAGLEPQRRGRKPTANPLSARVVQLERENARLQAKLEKAEIIIDVQKKVAALFAAEPSNGSAS